MTTYTWNPSAPAVPVDWNTPSDWLPASVPNSPDADVVIPEITQGSVPFYSDVTIENTESYIVHSLTLIYQTLFLNGSLSVVSDLTMGLGSELFLAGSLALGSLSNAGEGGPVGYNISGSGQISSLGTIDNQGAILSESAPLTLDFAGLQNAGLLFADSNMEVDVGSGPGAFTNLSSGTLLAYAGTLKVNAGAAAGGFLSDGTLSGGTYDVDAGAVINLNGGGDITADAATIILGDLTSSSATTPALLETEVGGIEHPLTQTLRAITPTGDLTLQRIVFADVGAVTVDGVVQLDASTFSAPDLTIQSDGTVGGNGTITGPVTNDGTLAAYDSTYGSITGYQTGANLRIDGSVAGTGTMAILSGDFSSVVAPEPTVLEIVSAATNAVTFDNEWNGVLMLDSPTLFAGSISGFTIGQDVIQNEKGSQTTFENSDSIILVGFSASAITNLAYNGTSAAGTLSFDDAGSSIALDFVGNYSLDEFVLSAGPQALSSSPPSVEISLNSTALCFLPGTMIATPAGETPVERLAAGDMVRTASGAVRPITWVGKGRMLATRGRRNAATPVIVRKGALADNVPHHDLRVTKGHSLFIDGVLIPVEFLVNHRSIYWDDHAQEVSLYHIELDTHDVLLANGAQAESYRDDGNRWLFQNANGGWDLPPRPPCAPVLTGGPIVDATWQKILERSGPRARQLLTEDPDLHLLVNGDRIDPVMRTDGVYVFSLPGASYVRRPPVVRIISRSAAPQELGIARDPRSLGIALRRIVIRQGTRFRVIKADDALLSDGLHAFEADRGFRWTNGDAGVPGTVFAGFGGRVEVVVQYAATAHYIDDGASRQAA
jgi:hypothetical protein